MSGHPPKTVANVILRDTGCEVLDEFPNIPLLDIRSKILSRQTLAPGCAIIALPAEIAIANFSYISILDRIAIALTCKRLATVVLDHKLVTAHAGFGHESVIYRLDSYTSFFPSVTKNPFYLDLTRPKDRILPRLDQYALGFKLCSALAGSSDDENILASPDSLRHVSHGLKRSRSRKLYITKGMVHAVCYEMIASLLVYSPPPSAELDSPSGKACLRWFGKEMKRMYQLLNHKEIEAEKRRQETWRRTVAMMPDRYRRHYRST